MPEIDAVKVPFAARLLDAEYKLDSFAQNIALWNAELPERFWRIVRKFGWWGAAYREAIFRLADHAQSREEQERDWEPQEQENPRVLPFPALTEPRNLHSLPLPGLDGANPLAFLAALGTLVACDRLARSADGLPNWLAGPIALSWGVEATPNVPVLHLPAAPPSDREFSEFIADRLPRNIDAHPAACTIRMLTDDEQPLIEMIRNLRDDQSPTARSRLDWVTALSL